MPLLRRRPLKIAAMVGGAGLAVAAVPAAVDPVDDAASDANRIDALTKLKALYVTGVLTEEQYSSEHGRLTEGIQIVLDRPGHLGPVQVVVIAYADGSFDGRVIDRLRHLRAGDAVRLIDLLFVAKDRQGEVVEIEEGDLPAAEVGARGELVRALFGADSAMLGSSPLARDGVWFLADEIPAGSAAAIALLEHRWAVPLRDAIDSAAGHDLVDRWIHREDLPPIEA